MAGDPGNDSDSDSSSSSDSGPRGGYDSTPVPKVTPGYTVSITFHRAESLPTADINTLSSDPFILAQVNTDVPDRHKQDPKLRIRVPTVRRDINPVWDYEWIVENIPASGFKLKARLYDEDPANHDDRLGNVSVTVKGISEGWAGISEQPYKLKRRMGSKRAYLLKGCMSMFRSDVPFSSDLVISIKTLGRTQTDNGGRVYTAGPCAWSQHFSPMFGRLAGTKNAETAKDGSTQERYDFEANQIQLHGPTPDSLYHRYVEFKPFVAGMFTGTTLKGRILNKALHHQHGRIYHYDRSTEYGCISKPSRELTKQFLKMAHWGRGGKVFTYVLTLDAQIRFTETGPEFGIDYLSKHSMHADCDNYIAFSGEFFVCLNKKTGEGEESKRELPNSEDIVLPAKQSDKDEESDEPSQDPSDYHLIIDNDSGTYRPNKDLLPDLQRFLEANLPGLLISTLDCNADADKLKELKEEQRKRRMSVNKNQLYMQAGSSTSSMFGSDDEREKQDAAANGSAGKTKKKDEVKMALKNGMHS